MLGTSAAGSTRVTRRRAVISADAASLRGRRAVKITVRCPAQVASSCQVTVLARVQRRAATRARRIAIRSGRSKTIQLRFTKAGRRAIRRGGRLSGVVRTQLRHDDADERARDQGEPPALTPTNSPRTRPGR